MRRIIIILSEQMCWKCYTCWQQCIYVIESIKLSIYDHKHLAIFVFLPMIGTESDWVGRVSATSSKKTVIASNTVILRDICKMRTFVTAESHQHFEGETRWPAFSRRHFQMHLFERKYGNLIKISMKFVAKGPITNITALVQIIAWRQAINWANDVLDHWDIYASLGLSELNIQRN